MNKYKNKHKKNKNKQTSEVVKQKTNGRRTDKTKRQIEWTNKKRKAARKKTNEKETNKFMVKDRRKNGYMMKGNN